LYINRLLSQKYKRGWLYIKLYQRTWMNRGYRILPLYTCCNNHLLIKGSSCPYHYFLLFLAYLLMCCTLYDLVLPHCCILTTSNLSAIPQIAKLVPFPVLTELGMTLSPIVTKLREIRNAYVNDK
jgi:hypothetical protein